MEKASSKNLHHYNQRLRKFANTNRKQMTKSAACMWKYVLKNCQMRGYQFRRERPILNYIADFACLDLKLVIEVDEINHQNEEQQRRDATRDQALSEVGFTTLRFTSGEVLFNVTYVRERIGEWIDEFAEVPPPSPRQRRTRRGTKVIKDNDSL